MIVVALALLGYAALLGAVAPRLLRRAARPRQAPRMALLLWHVTSWSAVLAVVSGTALLTLPLRPLWQGLGVLLRTCLGAVRATYCPSAPPRLVAGMALGALLILVARVVAVAMRQHRVTARWRRAHRAGLDLLDVDADGVTVVPHRSLCVYALPGRHPRVVMTTATLALLTGHQRGAALAHERAHLRGHHHLLIGVAGALERALPWVPLFRRSRVETARLVEMTADDRASARAGRRALVGALVRVAGTPTPSAALALAGDHTIERVERLLAPAQPVSRIWRYGAGLLAAVLAGLPIAALAVPVIISQHLLR